MFQPDDGNASIASCIQALANVIVPVIKVIRVTEAFVASHRIGLPDGLS